MTSADRGAALARRPLAATVAPPYGREGGCLPTSRLGPTNI